MYRLKPFFSSLFLFFLPFYLWAQNPEYDYEGEDDEETESLPYVEIKKIDNFEETLKQARDSKRVILLEMSASYCGYCKTLEEAIIKPMLRSGDYESTTLIRKLDVDSRYPMKDLKGKKSNPSEIASKMGVWVTPTLLFLDGHGREVGERVVGVNTLELYGGYVDEAIRQGLRKIRD